AEEDRGAEHLAEPRWKLDPAQPSRVDHLTRRFELTPFERDVLLLTAGIEIDGRFAELCAKARGSGGFRHPSFRLALASLPGGSWDALLPGSPLRRWEFVRLEQGADLSTARLQIDERIWHYLLGLSEADPRLRRHVRAMPGGAELAPSHGALAHALALTWSEAVNGDAPPVVRLEGRSASVQNAIAEAAARELGCGLLRVPVDALPSEAEAREAFVRAWRREQVLSNHVLLLDAHALEASEGAAESRRFARLLDALDGPVVVAGWAQPVPGARRQLVLKVPPALATEQREAWLHALAALGVERGREAVADDLVARFELDGSAVAGALGLARRRLLLDQEQSPALAVWDACRELSRQDLGELAQRVVSRASWEDLSLAVTQREQLQHLERCARQQYRVHTEWDFGRGSERGRGILALFSGPSGTGKTLAAEVLANSLRLDLYRVDLASITSKWIGETEKNLRRVFDGAEAGGAILLFDEADALFGQRGAVRESRDRHANLEVNYLLQRMETFRGLAILTTNLRGNLDPAMQRRLRFSIDFSYPDLCQREEIWRRVFPPSTPTEGLDPRRLARLSASGAEIHSIAWMAACLAADEQRAVNMDHVLRGARWEYQKTQRVLVAKEVEGW
ncbi:MAG TPA: ATP-binding protein, partial [Polyangiaceae bacterium]|nr:ATP-binding protein [Polyangiaceae bacterium]